VANRIHPTALIGAGVELGDDNVVGPYTVIVGPARIGDGNWIGPHVSIGGPAEYRGGPHPVAWEGELDGAGVVIGDRNIFREFVTVQQGMHEATTLGDDCYLLARSHVGHDCQVHDVVTLTGAVVLGGHAHVGSWANIGLGTVVHQRSQVGPGAMVGMGSAVRKDIPPFTIAVGNPARVTGVNQVGLSRLGCSDDVVARFTAYMAGRAPVPEDLPPAVSAELEAWEKLAHKESD
jgi:UDP-N-acetylglucosamine acyltransferase